MALGVLDIIPLLIFFFSPLLLVLACLLEAFFPVKSRFWRLVCAYLYASWSPILLTEVCDSQRSLLL